MRHFFVFLILLLTVISCQTKSSILWHFSKDDLYDVSTPQNKLDVDIYLDATTSMQGFTSAGATNYSNLLDDIELAVKNVWKETDVRFYKFTTQIDSLSREQFVTGKSDAKFYADRFTSNQINIDKTVEKTDPKRVSIIITDLFYKGQDINQVVSSLNESCIKKGVDIGILSVSSIFTGTVADVKPSVEIKQENRPLYVLIFGSKNNINQVFEAFKSKAYINRNQKLLITKLPLYSYTVQAEKLKDKTNKGINIDQGRYANLKEYGNAFGFKMMDLQQPALINFEMVSSVDPSFPIFNSNNLKFTVYKKYVDTKDSVLTQDLNFSEVNISGNKITGKIEIANKEDVDLRSYLIKVGLNNTVPLIMPDWIAQYDTDSYTSEGPKEKTIYLKKLLTEVSAYNTTYNNPLLGKFYLYLRK